MAEFQTSLATELESELPQAQSRGYPSAIIMGVTLTPEYIHIMSRMTDDVHSLNNNSMFGEDEFSMCSVLTNAPLQTVLHAPVSSQCGDCTVCVTICPEGAITGLTWTPGGSRDELVDVYKCTACLKCLVLCPWSQNYADSSNPR